MPTVTSTTLAEFGPLFAALAAVIAAVLAYMSSRRPKVDAATAAKIKAEIEAGQLKTQQEKALADARRDRYIVRFEKWAFEKVRPAWHKAVVQNDEQNAVLCELAARAGIPYEPKTLPELPDPPMIDDD